MNRYFYVPVMDPCVMHDGVSLRDHIRVVDPEIYERECKYFNDLCDFSFERGILHAKKLINAERGNKKTDTLYRERVLPRFLVLVYGDGRFYELSSMEEIDPISLGNISCFEIMGVDVVDVFIDNPNYSPSAKRFFDIYHANKHLLEEPEKKTAKQKVFQKLPFFRKRNS